MPNAIDLAPRRYLPVAARVCREAASRRGLSAMPYPGLRSATRWRRNPLATPSNVRRGVRYLAHLPIEGCWSAEHTRQWRRGFDLARRLGQLLLGDASRGPIQLAPAGRPTRPLPAKLPLDSLKNIARRARRKFICSDADLDANTIHCLRHVVGRVTRQILLQSIAEKLAAGTFGALSQPFRPFEDVVWYRYRRFHTKSITRSDIEVNRRSARGIVKKQVEQHHLRKLSSRAISSSSSTAASLKALSMLIPGRALPSETDLSRYGCGFGVFLAARPVWSVSRTTYLKGLPERCASVSSALAIRSSSVSVVLILTRRIALGCLANKHQTARDDCGSSIHNRENCVSLLLARRTRQCAALPCSTPARGGLIKSTRQGTGRRLSNALKKELKA